MQEKNEEQIKIKIKDSEDQGTKKCNCTVCEQDFNKVKYIVHKKHHQEQELDQEVDQQIHWNNLFEQNVDDQNREMVQKVYEQTNKRDYQFLVENFPQLKNPQLKLPISFNHTYFFHDGQISYIIQSQEKDVVKIVKVNSSYYPHRIRTVIHENLKKKFCFEDFPHLDLVIIKYTNKLVEMINDHQFSTLISRRKNDSIWKKINYIQIIQPIFKTQNFSLIDIKFNLQKEKESFWFERCMQQMKDNASSQENMLQKCETVEKDDSFEEMLMKQDVEKYLLYQVCKIYFQFLYYSQINILEMTVKIQIYKEQWYIVDFVDLYCVYQTNLDNMINQQIEINNQETSDKLGKMYKQQEQIQIRKIFAEFLMKQYSSRRFGIKIQPKTIQKSSDLLTNDNFAAIFPNSQYTLDQILNMQLIQIKELIIMNFQDKENQSMRQEHLKQFYKTQVENQIRIKKIRLQKNNEKQSQKLFFKKTVSQNQLNKIKTTMKQVINFGSDLDFSSNKFNVGTSQFKKGQQNYKSCKLIRCPTFETIYLTESKQSKENNLKQKIMNQLIQNQDQSQNYILQESQKEKSTSKYQTKYTKNEYKSNEKVKDQYLINLMDYKKEVVQSQFPLERSIFKKFRKNMNYDIFQGKDQSGIKQQRLTTMS